MLGISPTDAATKIIATIGPACQTVDKLVALIRLGVDIFRINSAHGDRSQHESALENIREAARLTETHVGILLDLSGPKIRLGQLLVDPFYCEYAAEVVFIRGDAAEAPNQLTSTYKRLVDELKAGDRVMLADGTVSLVVNRVADDGVHCQVTGAGEIRSRQGINLPGVKLSVSAMRPADVDNAIWGAQNGLDFISLSFVRSAEDVHSLRNLLTSYESNALVVAKIEKPEALDQLEAIVDSADAVMVARGDLGVEIDVAEIPVAQKRIIRVCREKLKPVIVATQMLDSMHHNRRPTRAEASDVANAILDGADACMLSGETAIGDFPEEAVATMNRIMVHTEQKLLIEDVHHPGQYHRVHPITSAVTEAATSIAEAIHAKLIVIATHSGGTAWVKSKSRSRIPTIGASDNLATLRRMSLFWGIKPLFLPGFDDSERLLDQVIRWGAGRGFLATGDKLVLVTGSGVMQKAHNLLIVHTVEPT
ncbi:MAG: pyruvate kinase [Planctomycetaceae bacterium]|nr:MAG: pyruvate kinase [Planctomycetaceae bacterium]